MTKPTYRMRKIVGTRSGDLIRGRETIILTLECGHIAVRQLRARCPYVIGETKARCYLCGATGKAKRYA